MDPGPKTNGKEITAVPQAGVANCDEMITLDCLRALYSIDYTPVATDKNSFGIGERSSLICVGYTSGRADGLCVVELTPQAFLAGDLDVFFGNFSSSQVGQRPTLISIDGGKNNIITPPLFVKSVFSHSMLYISYRYRPDRKPELQPQRRKLA